MTADKWDVRLENWALWYGIPDGSSSPHARISSIYSPAQWHYSSGTRPPPPLVGEALDTNALVYRLDAELFLAVSAWYVWTGSLDIRARQLRIHVNTLRNRVTAAKHALDAMWQAQRPHFRRCTLFDKGLGTFRERACIVVG